MKFFRRPLSDYDYPAIAYHFVRRFVVLPIGTILWLSLKTVQFLALVVVCVCDVLANRVAPPLLRQKLEKIDEISAKYDAYNAAPEHYSTVFEAQVQAGRWSPNTLIPSRRRD